MKLSKKIEIVFLVMLVMIPLMFTSVVSANVYETHGHVIAFGHYIEPPYQFRIIDDSLFLNDVQIDPPILPSWKKQPTLPSVSQQDRKISNLTKRIRAMHEELKVQNQQDNIQTKMNQYIANEERMVQNSEWVGSEELHLVMVTGEEFSMTLRDQKLDTNYAEVRKDLLKATKERYETSLQSGALLVIGYGPVLTVPDRYALETLEQIGTALKENSKEKLKSLLQDDELTEEIFSVQDPVLKSSNNHYSKTQSGPNKTPSKHVAVVIAPVRWEASRGEDTFIDKTGSPNGQRYITLSLQQTTNPGLYPIIDLIDHIERVDGTYSTGILLHTGHGGALK